MIEAVKAKFSDENETLFSEDAGVLSELGLQYDVCSDCLLSAEVCQKVYELIYSILGKDIDDENSACSIVLNNTGNGQIVLNRPKNSLLYVFNSDEYAFNIASVQSSVAEKNKHNEFFKVDISAIFGGAVNNNFNADVVICQGFCRELIYKEVDSEMFYRNLDCQEYFTLRASNLIKKSGLVVSIIPQEIEDKIISLCAISNMEKVASLSYGNVKIVFFKKANQ